MPLSNDISEWTKKEFENLPHRGWSEDIGEINCLVILPSRHIHDSGYRCMDFVAVIRNKPICRLSGCSDVVHINGIGGYGKNWLKIYGKVPSAVTPVSWSIDCLKKSGLLRIFCQGKLTVGKALSSFEIFGGTL